MNPFAPSRPSAFRITSEGDAEILELHEVQRLALALARGRFRGRGIVQAIVDLPFAVSPVVVGVSLILLWGLHGWFGGLAEHGFRVTTAADAASARAGMRGLEFDIVLLDVMMPGENGLDLARDLKATRSISSVR